MFATSSKIRTTIAVLAAASSVAVATGPVVTTAQAKHNNGAYQRWLKSRDHAVTCANLQVLANSESDEASDAHAAGDDAASREHSKNADQTYETARKAQCSWAS
jgi:hypothetical protein